MSKSINEIINEPVNAPDVHRAKYYRDYRTYMSDVKRARAALEHLGMSMVGVDDEPSYNGLVGFPVTKEKS